jgi:hypothetical protein
MQQIPKRRRKHAQESTEFDEEIAKLGRMFAVMYEPWVEDGLFQQPRPEKSSNDPERFKSEKAKEEGIIAELYEAVPEKLHRMLEDQSHFKTVVCLPVLLLHFVSCQLNTFQFTRAQGNERSSAVHRLRHECAARIFSTRAEYFDREYNRTELDEFKALLKPESSTRKFPAFAPVLYPPGSHMDSKKIFRSLILVNVCLLLRILQVYHL